MKTPRTALLAAAVPLVLLLWTTGAAEAQSSPPAAAASADLHGQASAGDAGACDPAVAEALARSAEAGVEADLAIIRHPGQGIRNPDSIFDFSCVWDLFDYSAFDVLFDPAGALDDILDLARRRVCAAGPRRLPPLPGARARRLGLHRAGPPPSRPRPRLAPAQRLPRTRRVRSGDGALFRDVVGDTRARGGR